MGRTTIKIDSEVHLAAVQICEQSGCGLVDYLSRAIREKNEKTMEELLKKQLESQENREAVTAYCLSVMNYNVEKAKKDRDKFMSLHESVFKSA